MNLEDLPDEVLELMLSYAGNKSVNNLGKTCKRGKTLVDECLTRNKVCDKDVVSCFMCTRYSISVLPIYYLVWPFEGDTLRHRLCSMH